MTFENRYSRIDRLLHRLAFSGIQVQKSLADLEDRLYAKRFADVVIDRPLFITSLPRAGTTLLLELLSGIEHFAAHTYRQMPFLLCPILWNSMSRPFQKHTVLRERAHGDGMQVGYDSVEAFEEILWHAFWPRKYTSDRIIPWSAGDVDEHEEFEPFLRNHMRKLLALRPGSPRCRYVSKNNANIARVPTLARLFPDGVILIPFRNPIDHVGSMLRQHRNFSRIHAEDRFAARYMLDIGHYDLGANLRPIDFAGWLNGDPPETTDTEDFWLRYWCEAFDHLLSLRVKNIVFVSYERCCGAPAKSLRRIAGAIGLEDPDSLANLASRFRAPTGYSNADLALAPTLTARAGALHDKLLQASIT
jgi:hypothetical protein